MTEHIVAVFETQMAAEAAAQGLRDIGIPASAIRQYASGGGNGGIGGHVTPVEQTSTHASGGGFWSWLFGDDTTSETTHSAYSGDAYDRRALAGNVVVSVSVDDDAKIHQAITALEAHHPIDIDERSDESEVGTGASMAPSTGASTVGRDYSSAEVARADMSGTGRSGAATAASATPSGLATPGSVTAGSATPGSVTPGSVTPGLATADGRTERDVATGEQVVSLSEERLDVGTRTVDRGVTRVRRYVVEKPVEETVTLHGERVTVERRRPVDSAAAPGAGAFEERVVEVHETAEEPVVAKTARVVEEVVVGREATERTETVRDTVRREEVEVTDNTGVKR